MNFREQTSHDAITLGSWKYRNNKERKKEGGGYVIRGNYHEAGRNGKYYIQRINQKYEDIKGLCQTEKSEPCKIPNHATVKRLRYDNKQVKMDETSEKSVTILP